MLAQLLKVIIYLNNTSVYIVFLHEPISQTTIPATFETYISEMKATVSFNVLSVCVFLSVSVRRFQHDFSNTT